MSALRRAVWAAAGLPLAALVVAHVLQPDNGVHKKPHTAYAANAGRAWPALSNSEGFLAPVPHAHNDLAHIDRATAAARDDDDFVAKIWALPPVGVDVRGRSQEWCERSFKTASMAAFRLVRASLAALPQGCPPNVTVVIPAALSSVLLDLSAVLKRKPSVSYASLVLNNCRRVADASGAATRFAAVDLLSGQPLEARFYEAHCRVEEAFAPAMFAAQEIADVLSALDDTGNIVGAIDAAGHDKVHRGLHALADGVRSATIAMKNMHRAITPQEFFGELRRYLKMTTRQDLNVTIEFQRFGGPSTIIPLSELPGPTGAMTPTLPLLDAVLGVRSTPPVDQIMAEYKKTWPVEHREIVDRLGAGHRLKDYVLAAEQGGDVGLASAFDDAVTAVAEFRAAHILHTEVFITVPSGAREQIGTGGSAFTGFLCQHLANTLALRVNPNRVGFAVPLSCKALLA